MKITLRQARRLEREIETAIVAAMATVNARQIAISIYQNFDKTIIEKKKTIAAAADLVNRLTEIRFGIRRKIEVANEDVGLNSKMNREAMLKAKLGISGQLAQMEIGDDDLAIASRRHSAAVATGAKADDYGRVTDSITIQGILNKAALEKVADDINIMKREVRALIDDMAAMNASCTIEVIDDEVSLLESVGVLV